MKIKTAIRLICFLTAMCLAITGAHGSAINVNIDEPGFEAAGAWKFGKTGAGVKGFFGTTHAQYVKAGLIDPLDDCGKFFAYNNGPGHDLYQVLAAAVAANTTYKLSIVAIDPTFANPFPGGQLQLGYVSDNPAKADDFGLNLIKPTKVVKPTPFNDKENNPDNNTDGLATWTYMFTAGASPAGLGKQLRIEILGGGKAQSIFDNVSLEAIAAADAEINSAARIAAKPPETAPVVVMLGDSTTDGGMTIFVKRQLDKLITPDLKRPNVINAGKGGDYATNALKRLEKDVLSHNPDIVTVSFGLNDAGLRKPDQFKESLLKIVKTLKDADIQVILMTSTPFNNDRHFWGKRKEYQDLGGLDEYMNREFCDRMRSVARDKNLAICDLHTIFKNEFKKDPDLINKVISTDGVHLTGDGYVLIAKHVAPVIQKLLTEKKRKAIVANEHKTYANPIIPGDWSDPGVVRVGEDYYTVRSSFGWQPGLHIAHSKDLIHWKYIGYADTVNAFDRPHGITERGIWGSDIGYNPNNKTFLVYAPMGGNIRVFYAGNPAGPYKDGGRLTNGYDPGFFADDDGLLYLTKAGGEVYKLTPDGLRIDGEPLAKVAGGEGPEIFKANGYYYYIISPGGTRPYQDHMIMSYRAKSLKGPWQEDPANPVMHAPHTTNAKLQGPGHGEVFQAHNGKWYLTYHAYELSHYSLGRQTCLEPVTWTDDGWWRSVNGKIPSERNPAPSLKQVACQMQDSDEFDSATLGKQWFFHAAPDHSGWSLTEKPGSLRIKTRDGDISSPTVAPNLFLQRVIHKKFDIVAEVTFDAQEANEAAGIHLYHDPDKSVWLTTTVVDGQKMFEVGFYDKPFKSDVDPETLKPHQINKTYGYRTAPKIKKILARISNTIGNAVFLKMSVDGQERASFFYSGDGKSWAAIDTEVYFGDSWHCSRLGKKPGSPDLGWVGCGRDNVWTATVMGVFACQNGAAQSQNADFQSFRVIKR